MSGAAVGECDLSRCQERPDFRVSGSNWSSGSCKLGVLNTRSAVLLPEESGEKDGALRGLEATRRIDR
jgi:hypothetical protein